MKKISFLTYIVIIFTQLGFSLYAQQNQINPLTVDLNRVQSYYPVLEGSNNEKSLLYFIEEELNKLKMPYTRLPFTSSDTHHSFSAMISVKIEGEKKDTLLITVPLNSPYYENRFNSGAANIALALGILEKAREKRPAISIQINFMGAEFGPNDQYPLGSRIFLENYFPDYTLTHFYLNFRNIPARIRIKSGGTGLITPSWLITDTTEALEKTGVPFLLRGNENQLYRFGLNIKKTIIERYLKKDIPSISFEGNYESLPLAERETLMENFIGFIFQFIEKYKEDGIPTTWDRHYLFFQAGSFHLIINEKTYLILFILVLSIVIIYILVFTRIFRHIIKAFLKHLWVLPLIFLIVYIYFLLSGLAIQLISFLKNDPNFWYTSPFLFFLLKVTLIALLFQLTKKFLHFFTHDFIFYSSAGIITLFINIMVLSFINISFTYYFLWAFIFFLTSNQIRNNILRLLFFLPAPYWIIKTAIEFLIEPQYEFSRIFLLADPLNTLVVSLLMLPFILIPIGIYQKVRIHKKVLIQSAPKTLNIPVLISFLVSLGLCLYMFLFIQYTEQMPLTIFTKNIIDMDKKNNTIEISGNRALRDINLWIVDKHYHFETEAMHYIIPQEEIPELIDIQVTQKSFLDRKNINISVEAQGNPMSLSLSIASDSDYTLFDSNFPYNIRNKGRIYDIIIGANPPKPINIQLTLPAQLSFELFLEMEYSEFPFRFEIGGANKRIESYLIIKKSLRIET